NKHYVLVRVSNGEEWNTLFVTHLKEPFRFETDGIQRNRETVDPETWAAQASPGDVYPFPSAAAQFKVRYRQRQGGVISKQIPGGEAYARIGTSARNTTSGEDAERLLSACRMLQEKGEPVSQVEINEYSHAVYRAAGQIYFITSLRGELEFPDGEEMNNNHDDEPNNSATKSVRDE